MYTETAWGMNWNTIVSSPELEPVVMVGERDGMLQKHERMM